VPSVCYQGQRPCRNSIACFNGDENDIEHNANGKGAIVIAYLMIVIMRHINSCLLGANDYDEKCLLVDKTGKQSNFEKTKFS
jgi:hypothetical protein